MDIKDIIKNKSFCPLPWTGFIVQQNGNVKNCILAEEILGNLDDTDIESILKNKKNINIKHQMLLDKKPKSCIGCHRLEKDKNSLDIVSQRLYYIKELKSVDNTLYDNLDNFDLHTVDIRWTNQCNQACVYCGAHNSTLWEKELGPAKIMKSKSKEKLRSFIFKNIAKLKNVYLAGGEPTLMNENIEFLEMLLLKNPKVNLRVNTNLSNTNTKVSKLIKRFDNVHWTVSVESTGEVYDYIRYGGDWKNFCTNLKDIQSLHTHKISFNMLHLCLNHLEIFNCVDFLKNLGFEDNAFIVGPLYTPKYYNILNLNDELIQQIKNKINQEIKTAKFLYRDGLSNIKKYLDSDFNKDITETKKQLSIIDARRNINSKKLFKHIYD